MKTNLFKTIALGILAFLFLAPTETKAQVANPYVLQNNMPCTLKIKYTFFSRTANGCTNPCASGTFLLPPSPPVTTIPVPASCIACAVQIDILTVNGVSLLPPLSAGFNTWPVPPNANAADPSGCSSSGMVNINVGPGVAQINP